MEPALIKYVKRQKIELLPVMNEAIADGLFVVIPAYFESETLPNCIESLMNACSASARVNVVVVVNHASNDSVVVKGDSLKLIEWCRQLAAGLGHNESFRLLAIEAFDLDPRQKGAGLARKIGMDQVALYCLTKSLPNSVIVSLDADTTVDSAYFDAIGSYFSDPRNTACSIYFEHPFLNSDDGLFFNGAIALYELHLRYYRQALRAAGFPYAFHTVGSALACRVSAYAKAGGMTKKQAGEDFYFVHKLVCQGGFGELNQTTVYPSSRASTRVIFGTGATVQKMIDDGDLSYQSYNLQAFADLAQLFASVGAFYNTDEASYEELILKLPGRVRAFLVNQSFYSLIQPIFSHCASEQRFSKRFFEVFNAFMVIKYLNFVHDHFLEKPDVCEVSALFLERNDILEDPFADVFKLLEAYRKMDKSLPSLALRV